MKAVAAGPVIGLDSLDLLSVGNEIQLGGAIYSGLGKVYLVPFPDEDLDGEVQILCMGPHELERFLNQTDVLDVQATGDGTGHFGKAILRKSQRQIDQHIAWMVFERDQYRCRYCGRAGPLTVDHVILWEQGGATVARNLVSACRRCNKLRGNMEYDEWLMSPEYQVVSKVLNPSDHARNVVLAGQLAQLRLLTAKFRSR